MYDWDSYHIHVSEFGCLNDRFCVDGGMCALDPKGTLRTNSLWVSTSSSWEIERAKKSDCGIVVFQCDVRERAAG